MSSGGGGIFIGGGEREKGIRDIDEEEEENLVFLPSANGRQHGMAPLPCTIEEDIFVCFPLHFGRIGLFYSFFEACTKGKFGKLHSQCGTGGDGWLTVEQAQDPISFFRW